MGLSRQVLKDVRLVLAIDPAIDNTKTNYDDYRETWDFSKLIFKDGTRPTIFCLRQLDSEEKTKVNRLDKLIDRANLAIRFGLVSVENYTIVSDEGSKELEQPKRIIDPEYGSVIPSEWMAKANFLTEELIAIGLSILDISEARPFSLKQ